MSHSSIEVKNFPFQLFVFLLHLVVLVADLGKRVKECLSAFGECLERLCLLLKHGHEVFQQLVVRALQGCLAKECLFQAGVQSCCYWVSRVCTKFTQYLVEVSLAFEADLGCFCWSDCLLGHVCL